MKAASGPLLALLATSQFVRADLWTLTLNGGGVVRWTSHDTPLSYGGNTFALGPMIQRGTISEKVGVEVATLDLTITANEDDLINGTALIPFIAKRGLDGATLKLERAYAPDWSDPIVGTVIRFAGKITSIGSIIGSTVNLTVSSWLVLLNSNMPRNQCQAGCMRTLYDAGCGVNPASFSNTGTVTVAGTQGFTASGLSGTDGYYSQGRIVFTSGPNAGLTRTVKTSLATGAITLIQPLPVAAAVGNTFTAYAGCDLAESTCIAKFSNRARFKGTPFVPLPTTSLGAATTTTTGGK